MFVYVVAGIVATALYAVATATPPAAKPGTAAAPVDQKSVFEKTVTFATSVLGGGFALYSFLLSVEQKRVEYAAKLIEKTIKAFLELVVRLTLDRMNPWIKGQRDKLKGYDPLKSTIYVELENLATRWKAEEETEAALIKLEQSRTRS